MKFDNEFLLYLAQLKLTGGEYQAFLIIASGITLKIDIEKALQMNRQNTHNYLKRLERKGLVRKTKVYNRCPVYEIVSKINDNSSNIAGQEMFYDNETFNTIVDYTRNSENV